MARAQYRIACETGAERDLKMFHDFSNLFLTTARRVPKFHHVLY